MDRENRHLRFVLRHYTPGMFDTRRAIREYKETHPRILRSWWRYAAAGAAAVVVLVTAAYFLIGRPIQPVVLYAADRSAVYTLPDSSQVTLYPHSSLSYNPSDFGKDARRVDMRGKVTFRVTRNPEAPFTASTSRAAVRVLGTQFTVDEYDADSIAVEVTSGKVLFTASGEKDGLVLTKGMSAYLLADNSTPVLDEKTAIENAAATPRRFVYDNTPLAEVLRELSDHFNVTLTCATPDKRLTAEFDTADLDEIIMVIEKSLDVKIVKKQR